MALSNPLLSSCNLDQNLITALKLFLLSIEISSSTANNVSRSIFPASMALLAIFIFAWIALATFGLGCLVGRSLTIFLNSPQRSGLFSSVITGSLAFGSLFFFRSFSTSRLNVSTLLELVSAHLTASLSLSSS